MSCGKRKGEEFVHKHPSSLCPRSIQAPVHLGDMSTALSHDSETAREPTARWGLLDCAFEKPITGQHWADHAEIFATTAAGAREWHSPSLPPAERWCQDPRWPREVSGRQPFPHFPFLISDFFFNLYWFYPHKPYGICFWMGQGINKMQQTVLAVC